MTDTYYCIRVKGHLRPEWSEWFDGMAITWQPDGSTTLRGPLPDQPALHGLLARVRDLGLTLLSVQATEDDQDNRRVYGTACRSKPSGKVR